MKSKSSQQLNQGKKLPVVDIGIACYGMQPPQWWLPIMVNLLAENNVTCEIGQVHASMAMLKDHNKNGIVDNQKDRNTQTDEARQQVTIEGFMAGNADYLMFIDDDTVPPKGTIGHLLGLKRPLVSGLYFSGGPDSDPIAYTRNPDGSYTTIGVYTPGSVFEIDSIGMGCALIHRSVFEKIKAEHEVFITPKAALVAIHKSKILDHKVFKGSDKNKREVVTNGTWHIPLQPMPENDVRPFPFFALENSRTEDHHFCELADAVGIKPYLDTNVICEHWKLKAVTKETYKDARMKGRGI